MRLLYATTVFLSALLLFLVQPIISKALLPLFGGSAGVWTTSMLFFQLSLLAGYAYAHYVASRGRQRLHVLILLASLIVLPLTEPTFAANSMDPVLRILGILTVTAGMPYFALAATSPLLQEWYPGAVPYRLYAASNAGSLAALALYPFVLEPAVPLRTQMTAWSLLYALDALLLSAIAWRATAPARPTGPSTPDRSAQWTWLALSACASGLWMAVANHLSQDVAAVPFLWLLPLALYLFSFVLTFESDRWYRPRVFRWLMPVAWAAIGVGVALGGTGDGKLLLLISMFSGALFLCCMFCHGELAARKPPAAQLTRFYLVIASGGALGGIFVGLIAPRLFNELLELPLLLIANFVLAFGLLYGTSSKRMQRLALTACAGVVVALATGAPSLYRARNFYGALQVVDNTRNGEQIRQVYHGTTQHGCQILSARKSRQPTAYYGPESGAGRALKLRLWKPARVGIIGLGAGTLSTYAEPGDTYRFYEINPLVLHLARTYFSFLKESAVPADIVLGDARISLQQDPTKFHILLIDAFSGDSIPVHLLTREAFRVWKQHIVPDGILGIHVTNRYLDLMPVLQEAASEMHLTPVWIHSGRDEDQQIYPADWVLLTNNTEALRRLKPQERPLHTEKVRAWTDDYSSLFEVLK